MTGWQIGSVLNLGFSAALAAGAIGVAAVVWFNDEAFAFAAAQSGLVGTDTGARLFLSIGLGAAGCLVAYYLLEFQQWFANFLARRKLRRLERRFNKIAQDQGSEAAAQWLAPQLIDFMADDKVDLFGGPQPDLVNYVKYLGGRVRIGLRADG